MVNMLYPIWYGIELIQASDKTPKRERKGNYYTKVASSNGNYEQVLPIDIVNGKMFRKLHREGKI